MIDTVIGTHFIDKKLQPSTEYSYTVKAIDAAGNVSKESTALTVKTTVEIPDTEAPTQPKGLHSMGTTASSVDLMWSPSDDNIGVELLRWLIEKQKDQSKKDCNIQYNFLYG